MKINFIYYLSNKKVNPSIIASIICKGERLQIASGYTISHEHWNKSASKVKASYNKLPNRFFKDSIQFNAALDNFKKLVFDYIHGNENDFSKEALRAYIKAYKAEKLGKGVKALDTIIYNFDAYISESESLMKPLTIKKIKTLKNYFVNFQSAQKRQYYLSDINDELMENYINFLYTHKLTINSIHKMAILARTFFNWLYKKKLITGSSYKNVKLPGEKEAAVIALSTDELELIENFQTDDDRLQRTRDLFLIQCYTGIRYSDLHNLKPENVDFKSGKIRLHQIKTTEVLIIGIHTKLEALLRKYECNLPKISNQKYNDALKGMAKEAKILEPVQIVKYYGKTRQEEKFEKWQLVTTHTARRTFITLSLKKGALPEMVMKISGHKSRASFQKYVKITQNEAVDALKELWD